MSHLVEDPRDWMGTPYNVRARGQKHRDAPLSPKERHIWRYIWLGFALLAAAMIVVGLLR